MEHGINTSEELDFADRWDRMAMPYDEKTSQEEQRLYRGDVETTVPLKAFLIVAAFCIVLVVVVAAL